MSATPDYMTQLLSGGNNTGLNGMFTNSMYSPQMGLALGLLQAGGPSRMPVSLGQALGQGMQTGQQFQGAGLQNAMQRLMLGKTGMQMGMLQDALNPQQQPPQQAPAPAATDTANAIAAPQTQGAGFAGANAASQITGQPASIAQAMQPSSQSIDPYQDPVYLRNQKIAQVMDMMQPGSGAGYAAAASQRIDYLTKERSGLWQTVDPKDYAALGLTAQQPGVTWQRNTQTGEVMPKGESIYMPISGQGPSGAYQQGIFNKTTGQTTWPTNNASQRTPGTALTNPADESYAQGLAEYKYKPPAVGQRNSGQALNWLARANELNPAFDENAYDAKHAAYLSMASGKDYAQNSAYSTIQTHMSTLDNAFNALNNGDIQSANKLSQWSGKQFGKSAPQNAKVVNDIVVGELAKVLAQGGQVTDSVRKEASGDLEPFLSQGQYTGATNYIRELIAGKMNTSFINARASKIPDDVFLAHLTPEAREQLQLFRQSHPDQQTGATGNKTLTYDPASGTFK